MIHNSMVIDAHSIDDLLSIIKYDSNKIYTKTNYGYHDEDGNNIFNFDVLNEFLNKEISIEDTLKHIKDFLL